MEKSLTYLLDNPNDIKHIFGDFSKDENGFHFKKFW